MIPFSTVGVAVHATENFRMRKYASAGMSRGVMTMSLSEAGTSNTIGLLSKSTSGVDPVSVLSEYMTKCAGTPVLFLILKLIRPYDAREIEPSNPTRVAAVSVCVAL